MRNLFILLLFVFAAQFIWAQDVIVTFDNQRINAELIEQNKRFIKYKKLDSESQPIAWIKSKDVHFIEFETGDIQYLYTQNRRAVRPLGVSTGLSLPLGSGSGVAFASVDYYFLPQLSLEANVGRTFDGSSYYALGAKYHLNSKYRDNKFAPFVGLLFDTEYFKGMLLVPFGFTYISDNGFYASFAFNQSMFFDLETDTNFEFKFGFRRRK
jgi:hypothetical protein